MKVIAFVRGESATRPQPNNRVRAIAQACGAPIRDRQDGLIPWERRPDFIIHAAMKPLRSAAVRNAMQFGIPILVVEHGYYFNRLEYMSLGWNGINGRALRPAPGREPRPFPVLKDWVTHKPETGRILIPLQVPHDASLEGVDIEQWAFDKHSELQCRYPRATIHIRPHPENGGQDCPPLLDVIRDYALVATYSSNVGVDAIRMGVPATADSPMSMIYGKHHFKGILHQDREREIWAHWLSYCQWKEDESEVALEHMLKALPEAKENAQSGRYGRF